VIYECNGKEGEAYEIRDVIVEVDRFEVIESDEVRLLSDEEETTLIKLRHIFNGTEKVEIPSLKGRDRRKVMKEVSVVNSLLHNIDIGEVNVSSVNRLIYAGS